MIYTYDTEFLEDGRTIDLISIGIVAEDGREYYAVASDADWGRIRQHDWLCKNVVPHLPVVHGRKRYRGDGFLVEQPTLRIDMSDARVKPRWVIANEVREFLLGPADANELPHVELFADYGAYDHVALCQLWGTMVDLPEGLPMFTRDLQQAADGADLPEQQAGSHNALEDARHVMVCLRHLGAVGANDPSHSQGHTRPINPSPDDGDSPGPDESAHSD